MSSAAASDFFPNTDHVICCSILIHRFIEGPCRELIQNWFRRHLPDDARRIRGVPPTEIKIPATLSEKLRAGPKKEFIR